ncbi:MAG TPA: hypothetical protein PK941_14315, partial [Paludibacter sp.]|nr:hypothetical protein [Paludibacter sp.]
GLMVECTIDGGIFPPFDMAMFFTLESGIFMMSQVVSHSEALATIHIGETKDRISAKVNNFFIYKLEYHGLMACKQKDKT